MPSVFNCLLHVSLFSFFSLYRTYPFQASFMIFSAPNLVFVGCVAFSLLFSHLLLLYKFYSGCCAPLFRTVFFMVCCFFSPFVRHIILVLYLAYTFHLYFGVCVFSLSMLFPISCSFLLFNPYQLLYFLSCN